MTEALKMYIDGEWVSSLAGKTRKIINPANQDLLGIVAEGDAGDVDRAVKAARRAFDNSPWRDTKAIERAELLRRLADAIEEHLNLRLLERLSVG